MTHTRTHTYVGFADPYLVCTACQAWVTGFHNPGQCGCGQEGWQNQPCGHQAGVNTVCPSWGPVDGCRCITFSGDSVVKHAVPPGVAGKVL